MELTDGIRGMWRYVGSENGVGRFEAIKEARKITPAPYIQTDTLMEPVEHPMTGELYDSKSALRRSYKAMGLRETGNYTPKTPKVKGADFDEVREEVQEARRKLKWGMAPLTEREKWLMDKENQEMRRFKERNRGGMMLTEGEDQIAEKMKFRD